MRYKKSLKIPNGYRNQNPSIEEAQTTQQLKEKGQKDKQISKKKHILHIKPKIE